MSNLLPSGSGRFPRRGMSIEGAARMILEGNDLFIWELRALRDPSIQPLVESILEQKAKIAKLEEELEEEKLENKELNADLSKLEALLGYSNRAMVEGDIYEWP